MTLERQCSYCIVKKLEHLNVGNKSVNESVFHCNLSTGFAIKNGIPSFPHRYLELHRLMIKS